MIRYVAIHRPKAWSSASAVMEQRPTCTVHEDDDAPVYTGIIDQHGVGIYRTMDKAPLGFRAKARTE